MYKIIAGNCNTRHSQKFRMFRSNGFHCHVMLVVKSPSLFKIDGHEFTVGTNHVFLIRPNTPYEYRSICGNYVNDWLHFECEYEALSPEFQKLYHQPIPLLNVMHFSSYMQQLQKLTSMMVTLSPSTTTATKMTSMWKKLSLL